MSNLKKSAYLQSLAVLCAHRNLTPEGILAEIWLVAGSESYPENVRQEADELASQLHDLLETHKEDRESAVASAAIKIGIMATHCKFADSRT